MGIAYGANYGKPSLDLNFARNKSLIDTISGQNLVTFTRSQTNYLTTYVGSDGLIKYASANEPRFDHNPLTGECLGLLIEESRTNIVQYSTDFTNAWWNTSQNISIVPNTVLAPDGTITGSLIYPSVTGTSYVGRTGGAVSSSAYTTTIYAKSAGFSWMFLYGAQGNNKAYFNLSTGVVGTTDAGITASITPVGNGWYRCVVTQTVTFVNHYVGPCDANGSTNATPSGTFGIYIWGFQAETGSFPTSYIPTTGSTVTRTADNAEITGTNFSRWYNQSEGTLFGQFIIPPFSSNTVNSPYVYKIGTSANLTGTGFYIGNNTNQEGSLIYGSGIAHGDIAAGTRVKNAIGYTQSNGTASATVNGAAVSFGTSGTIPIPASDKIDIGNNNSDGRFYLNSTINRITYYPTRLQNFQLQQLTK